MLTDAQKQYAKDELNNFLDECIVELDRLCDENQEDRLSDEDKAKVRVEMWKGIGGEFGLYASLELQLLQSDKSLEDIMALIIAYNKDAFAKSML